MGVFDFFKKSQKGNEAPEPQKSNQKLTYVEKETLLVEQVTTQSMVQFSEMPYDLDCPVRKFFSEHGHPFAYMDLNSKNQTIARQELEEINNHLKKTPALSPYIPHSVGIPLRDIAFKQYSPHYGYTRIICTPYTPSGKVSKYPLYLSFMTRLDVDSDTTHGEMFYAKDGSISKGTVNCWRRGEGYFFEFKTVDGSLTLHQIKSTVKLDEKNLPITLYRAES